VLLRNGVETVLNCSFHVFIISQRLEVLCLAIFLGPFEASSLFKDNDSNTTIFERVTVNHYLGNEVRETVLVLQFLRGDVLSMRKLEYVFHTVNNLNRSIGVDYAHIAR